MPAVPSTQGSHSVGHGSSGARPRNQFDAGHGSSGGTRSRSQTTAVPPSRARSIAARTPCDRGGDVGAGGLGQVGQELRVGEGALHVDDQQRPGEVAQEFQPRVAHAPARNAGSTCSPNAARSGR